MTNQEAQSAQNADMRTMAMRMRGTPADTLKVRRLLDEVAILAPDDRFGHALYEWAEEATTLLELLTSIHAR